MLLPHIQDGLSEGCEERIAEIGDDDPDGSRIECAEISGAPTQMAWQNLPFLSGRLRWEPTRRACTSCIWAGHSASSSVDSLVELRCSYFGALQRYRSSAELG